MSAPADSETEMEKQQAFRTLLKNLPWEWVWRGSVAFALLSVMVMADKHYDDRYDARYLKRNDYERDLTASAQVAAAKSETSGRELSLLRGDVNEIKSDVKSLLLSKSK